VAVFVIASLQNNFAADSNLSKLAAANNTFAFKLLKQLAAEQPDTSIFVSPYSAATALQMAANGAGGQTKTEMQRVLQTTNLTTSELCAASKAAAGLLNSSDKNIILTTTNALWYRQGAQIKPDFLAANQKYDFANLPAAEAEINHWASDQTHGRITGIADGMIDPHLTDLVLANAIYFKGKWEDPFKKKWTKERPFHSATGATKNVPMMKMSKEFIYCQGTGYQAVRLPYMGYDLALCPTPAPAQRSCSKS
jgi:serpin B